MVPDPGERQATTRQNPERHRQAVITHSSQNIRRSLRPGQLNARAFNPPTNSTSPSALAGKHAAGRQDRGADGHIPGVERG